MHNATTQDTVRKPYRQPELMSIGSLLMATRAGSKNAAETNCLFAPSLSGGMKATNTNKASRC